MYSKYRVSRSRNNSRYGVGRDHLISDTFSVFELYPPGYVFADMQTAERVAAELNEQEEPGNYGAADLQA